MKVTYTERAQKDLTDALSWYRQVSPQLAMDLLDLISSSVSTISEYPTLYPKRWGDIRGCPIKRFPYMLYYGIEQEEIVIYAIFPTHQDPAKAPARKQY